MAQAPWKIDQLQIEPGATGTRLINRATDGSLQFTDPFVTGGITLAQLAGLKSMANVLMVGKSGAGAGFSTIQSALDTIPASSGPGNPYFVFVGPGVYQETVNIVRDGVFIFGFGAILQSLAEATPDGPGAYHTMVIQAALGTIPRLVEVYNLAITNAHTNYACVRIVGGAASEVGRYGILFQDCQLDATGSGRPVWATSANYVRVKGGGMSGCNPLALAFADNCAEFILDGVADVPNVEADYDTTGAVPFVTSSAYRFNACGNLGRGGLSPAIKATLTGAGKLDILGSSGGASCGFLGNRAVNIQGSKVGAISVSGTVALTLSGSQRGLITVAGTPTVAEPLHRGTAAFIGTTSQTVTFTAAEPDLNYSLSLETDTMPASNNAWWITAKTVNGFTINFLNAQTLTATWAVHRVM